MIPTPHLSGAADGRCIESHKRLMVAVLRTVVDDCRGSVYRRAAGYRAPTTLRGIRQANAYVASTDRAWPFSFENLCEALGVDAGCIRQQLRKEQGT